MQAPATTEYQLSYTGQWLSLNKIYGMNRHVAAKLKKEWQGTFTQMFAEAGIKPLATFSLTLRYWSRIDADGTVAGLKVLIDSLRYAGLIANDDKRYFRGFTVIPDATLTHNQYEVTIRGESLA